MKSIQRYVRRVDSTSTLAILCLFIFAYLIVAALFAGAYSFFKLAEDSDATPLGYWDCFYFSFVTQATIGFGDIHPVSQGRLLVIIQGIIGLLIVVFGTGVLVFRFLTPQRQTIDFDPHMVFDPDEKRFRVRIVNRLPVMISCPKIEMRFRYKRATARGEGKWSRKAVKLLRNSITILPPMRPFLISTAPIEIPTHGRNFRPGDEAIIEPACFSDDSSILIILEAKTLLGDALFSHEWNSDSIRCGHFVSTYNDEETISVAWSAWDLVTDSKPDDCARCTFSEACYFKTRPAQTNP